MPNLKQSLLEMASEGHTSCRKSFDTFYDTADDRLRREGFLLLLVGERDNDHIQQVRKEIRPLAQMEADALSSTRAGPRETMEQFLRSG